MSINVHIERLVLDSDAVAAGDSRLFSTALRSELGRLLAEGGTPPITQGAALPSLRAAPVSVDQGAGPQAIGCGVARSIYGGLARR
jgi:hypothetical protein